MNKASLRLEIALAMRNMTVAKMRSFLAILGIAIGTASVIALVSLGQLATRSALEAFRQLGTQVLAVHWSDKPFDNRFILDALKTQGQDLKAVLPMMNVHPSLHYQQRSLGAQTVASTPLLARVAKFEVASGRLLLDVDRMERHCVVGANVANKMKEYGGINPVGQWLRMGDYFYRVVGVLKPWKARFFLMLSADDMIWVSLEQAIGDWQQHYIQSLVLLYQDHVDVRPREARIKVSLAQWASKKRFFIHSPQALMQQVDEQQQRFRWLLGIMGGIALMVGGIGIMNLMLVVVFERRREIGIRLAIGASVASLLRMFIMEAAVLSCVGGFFGVLFGVVLTYLLAKMADWPFYLLWMPLFLGWGVSVATGVFFGFYPALKASRMCPIDALRGNNH